jgi:hypothetical protein
VEPFLELSEHGSSTRLSIGWSSRKRGDDGARGRSGALITGWAQIRPEMAARCAEPTITQLGWSVRLAALPEVVGRAGDPVMRLEVVP